MNPQFGKRKDHSFEDFEACFSSLHHSSPLNVCRACSIFCKDKMHCVHGKKSIKCFLLLAHALFPMKIESIEDLLVLYNGSSFGFLLNANNHHHNDNHASNR